MREEDLEAALYLLNAREREVLRLYFGLDGAEGCTLEEIGGQYGLTRERIRQIRNRALAKLRYCPYGHRLASYLEHEPIG